MASHTPGVLQAPMQAVPLTPPRGTAWGHDAPRGTDAAAQRGEPSFTRDSGRDPNLAGRAGPSERTEVRTSSPRCPVLFATRKKA